MSETPPLVRLRSVSKSYLGADIETRALDAVDLEIVRGEFVAIAGPSGCGKSTLLNVLGLLEPPEGGEYLFDGRPVGSLPEGELARLRNRDFTAMVHGFYSASPDPAAYAETYYKVDPVAGTFLTEELPDLILESRLSLDVAIQ